MGENTKYEDLSDFFVQYLSLGWYDVNHALTIMKESKIWIPEFGGWASDYMDDICQPLHKLDIVTLVMEYIFQEAKNELFEIYKNHGLLETCFDNIWIFSNYCDSHYQGTEELYDFLKKVNNKDTWSNTLKWFYSDIEY
jgi:hypothetical protein